MRTGRQLMERELSTSNDDCMNASIVESSRS